MIKALMQWYNDIRFPDKVCNTVEVVDAYWWRVRHYPGVDVKSEIKDWLQDNVQGRYWIHRPTVMLTMDDDLSKFDPHKIPCQISFSRATEALTFKLVFS